MHPRRFRSLILFGGALILAARLVNWSDQALGSRLEQAAADEQLIYAPPTRFLQVVALGYEHVLADALWFRTINYFGKHYHSDRTYPWLAHMCDRVTDLDPRAEHVYRFAGFLLPWEVKEVDAGISILEKGVRNIPESWDLRYMLGFSYYYFKDDLAAASRTLREAMALPGVPEYMGQLLAVIDAAHRGPDSAIEFLSMMANAGSSPEMRDAALEQVRNLTLTRDVDVLEAAARQFQEQRGRRPQRLEELVGAGLLAAVPADPFGGRYVIDATSGSIVTTSGRKPARLGSSEIRKSILSGERPGGKAGER